MPRRSDRIYAVVWTPRQHVIVPTKKAGRDKLRAWKASYERAGWALRTSGPDAYIATEPLLGIRRAIAFHEYDSTTHERLWEPPKPQAPTSRTAPNTPKPRRGRAPVGA